MQRIVASVMLSVIAGIAAVSTIIVSSCGSPHNTPQPSIMRIVIVGDETKLREALAAGADPNYRDPKHGDTPLICATAVKSLAKVQILVESGADPRHPGALPAAVSVDSLEIVRYLLEHGADPNASRQGGIPRALIEVSRTGNVEIFNALVERGVDVRAQGPYGPLRLAASYGHNPLVEALIRHGSPINVPDEEGHTPLWWAVHSGHTDIAEILRAHGGH